MNYHRMMKKISKKWKVTQMNTMTRKRFGLITIERIYSTRMSLTSLGTSNVGTLLTIMIEPIDIIEIRV